MIISQKTRDLRDMSNSSHNTKISVFSFKGVALEAAPYGVTCNVICPGYSDAPSTFSWIFFSRHILYPRPQRYSVLHVYNMSCVFMTWRITLFIWRSCGNAPHRLTDIIVPKSATSDLSWLITYNVLYSQMSQVCVD